MSMQNSTSFSLVIELHTCKQLTDKFRGLMNNYCVDLFSIFITLTVHANKLPSNFSSAIKCLFYISNVGYDIS